VEKGGVAAVSFAVTEELFVFELLSTFDRLHAPALAVRSMSANTVTSA
jgi:hypothetical protein